MKFYALVVREIKAEIRRMETFILFSNLRNSYCQFEYENTFD